MTSWRVRARRALRCDGASDSEDALGVVEDALLEVQDGVISAFGPYQELAERLPAAPTIIHEGLLTPGLVDAHTHSVWVGNRGREYALRMAGQGYEAIGKAGGGILASMRAIRGATTEQLADSLAARLRRMASLGVTTIEVKSGYGLNETAERSQLEAIARVSGQRGIPHLVPTFLGLHALPPEAADHASHALACRSWLEGIAQDGLARYVDAYIDRAAFSVVQARPVLERAIELGLGIRLHVGQFADVGGIALAAELGAASADHLEQIDERGAALMAERSIPAVLLPVASFTLDQEPPPVDLLRREGVTLIVASDANPGSAPSESLPLAMAMAVRSYGLSIQETILGATRHAAASLGSEAGVLRVGAPADLVLWDLQHEAELVQPWGVSRASMVMRDGQPLVETA